MTQSLQLNIGFHAATLYCIIKFLMVTISAVYTVAKWQRGWKLQHSQSAMSNHRIVDKIELISIYHDRIDCVSTEGETNQYE